MDLENSNPEVKDLLNSWIPVTPVKSILTQPQPICAEEQENQLGQAKWLESEKISQEKQLETLSTALLQHTQARSVVACCDSTSNVDLNQGFDKWEEALTRKSRVSVASDTNAIFYNTFSLDSMESSENISLLDLLAFTGSPGASSISASANAISPGNVDVTLGSQIASNQLESSSCPNSSAKTNRSCNYTPEIPRYENLIPCCPSYDLNSPARTIGEVWGSTISLRFAPITPDQAKRVENRQVSGKQSEYQRTDQAEDTHENEGANRIDRANQLHDEQQSLLLNGSSCAAVSTPIQEDHNPDKGDSNVIDQNRTPQQKQRRKKHRPKVVIEGQPTRTRKPAISELSGKKENPTGKRKYVRRKGLNKSTATPSAEVTSKTTHSETAAPTAKSCRKSLNFNLESREKDENSSVMPPSNVNSESQAQDFYATIQQRSAAAQLGKPIEVIVKKTQVGGIADDLTHSTNQVLEGHISLPERNAPSPLTPTKADPPHEKMKGDVQHECTRGKCQIIFSNQTHDKQGDNVQMMKPITQPAPRSPDDSNWSSSASLSKRQEARGLKRDYPYTVDDRLNVMGAHYNSVQAYMPFPVQESNTNRIPAMHFPAVCKKKRTEKGHNSTTSSILSTVSTTENSATEVTVCPLNDDCTGPFTSKTNCRTLGAQFSTSITPAEAAAVKSAQSKQQTCQSMLALGQKERLTRKRSKGPVRVRDWASFTGIVGYKQVPSSGYVQGFEISNQPNTYAEVQAALSHPTTGPRKRTKRNSFVSSAPSYIYNHQKSHFKSIGPPPNVPWESLSPIDAIVEGLKHLDIDKKTKQVAYQEQTALVPYNMRYLEQNALVLYQRDGTVVPFEGSYDPVKKRRSRAKVDLDEETNRVWKLLLENINSEGIDGTDEEKAKWWEEERRVFRGRADSFIARMHLVQGDRRFSQWKGSVVDSVIGVFLTQNVSDHLSSSAFMSLAARFPLKSKSNCVSCTEENPDSCILDTEYTIKWQEDKSNQPTCNQSSINLHDLSYCEEKSVIDSNESIGSKQSNRNDHERFHESAVNISTTQIIGAAESFMENQIEIDDVLSSQNSVDSSIAQTADRMGAHLLSDSEADQAGGPKSDCFNSFTSFMELLLHKAGTSMLHAADDNVNGIMSSAKMGGHSQAQTEESDSPKENMDSVDHPKASLAPITPFSNYQLHTTTQQVVEVGCSQMLEEESFSYNFSKQNEENCKSEQSGMTAGSISETTVQKIASVSFQEMPTFSTENNHTCNNVQRKVNDSFQSQSRQVGDSSSNIEAQAQKHNQMQKVLETPKCLGLDVTESSSTIDNSRNTEASKDDHNNIEASKVMKGRMGKEKQKVVDWDSLRKQAQAGSQKRERTSNTMDSLDWEAVRCADVNEIANTIKERGMNNMLAERMKDFLNRIVRDHGSIDLEWLRDVPPDKAKEYLLSIRGLGLKSVECVRLLTLHHLAFPVDTNVGRIAVRLGWVPLQPLPESLQLHLLELYPVLESIQKYLWPRLCKLDQRTLYELHYQMITFGKVFCTKSKPNCNACPMRGECRHFASAFASARLALPGPEEKSIVSAPESKATNQNHMGIIHPLQLPLPQTNEQSGSQPVINNSEPIIEVPATPEPIIEVPATPELENTQIPETDIEDTYEDPEEIPTIKLNIEEFTQNLQNYMQQNMELQECDMSKALVALTPEAASIPMPKLKNVSRLRTEHQVYELPDSHPLLERLDKREPDDPCPYLLAIWTPGETANSIQPPERRCSSQEFGNLCDEMTCFSCNSIREANSQIVRGTLLIPCRTAMRGSFPLNGTYFQVNEVFADHNSSINPIDIPRSWIWNLPRRTVYFGTSIPTIFKGLSTEGIQYCFWRGFVCVRGFDQKTRAPRPLMARLHFPASKLTRTKGKTDDT